MEWLKDHAYLASWLSPIVAIIIFGLQVRRPMSAGKPVHWMRVLFTFLCLISFPIVVTPTFDQTARSFATIVFSVTIGGLLTMRNE
jgi:hypothetical protein